MRTCNCYPPEYVSPCYRDWHITTSADAWREKNKHIPWVRELIEKSNQKKTMLEARTTPKLTVKQEKLLRFYDQRKRGAPLRESLAKPESLTESLIKMGLIYWHPYGHYSLTNFGANVVDQLEFEAREK